MHEPCGVNLRDFFYSTGSIAVIEYWIFFAFFFLFNGFFDSHLPSIAQTRFSLALISAFSLPLYQVSGYETMRCAIIQLLSYSVTQLFI